MAMHALLPPALPPVPPIAALDVGLADAVALRATEADADPLFVGRWSPRAFHPRPVTSTQLRTMLEAARWAPSSMNLQPWRFHVTTQGEARQRLEATLAPNNRSWARHAGALVLVSAKTQLGPNPYAAPASPNRHAAFDTGMAAIQFVLQGERLGLRSHFIGGFDANAARAAAAALAPDEEPLALIAVGHQASAAALPEGLRAREQPSQRKPLDAIATFA